MFLSSLLEELCTKQKNNKAGFTLTFRGQYILKIIISKKYGNSLKRLNYKEMYLCFGEKKPYLIMKSVKNSNF